MPNFKVPSPGQVVTVTTRYKNGYYYSDSEFEDTTYENVPVIAPQSWTKPNEFCIPAEGEPFITVRTIDINNVITLTVEGKVGEVETSTSTEYKKVPGGKGKTYVVTIINNIATTCECLGFQYRRQCRHLRIAMGETPVNPRRETIKKQRRKVATQKRAVRTSSKPTKADHVRRLIAQAKKERDTTYNNVIVARIQEVVINQAIDKVGFKPTLAKTYVLNNWNKVWVND